MRARAQIGKLALCVKAYILALGNILCKLRLVRLVLFLKELNRFVSALVAALKIYILFYNLLHFRLDFRKILGREFGFYVKIIVKSVVNSGADCELCVGVKPFYRLRHNV